MKKLLTIMNVTGREEKIEELASALSDVTKEDVKFVIEGEGKSKHAHVFISSSEMDMVLREAKDEKITDFMAKEKEPNCLAP